MVRGRAWRYRAAGSALIVWASFADKEGLFASRGGAFQVARLEAAFVTVGKAPRRVAR